MLNWPWLRPQQVLREDVSIIIPTAGVQKVENILDQNPDTQAVVAAGVQTILVNTLHPVFIGRVLLNGALNAVSVLLIAPDGTTTTIGPVTGPSLDSGPLVPRFIIGARINQGVASPGSLITELTILKVIPVQAQVVANVVVNVDNTPDAPLFVQDQAEISSDEVTIALIGFAGNSALLFDRNIATGVATPASTAGNINVALNAPLLVSRIGLVGKNMPVGTTITLAALDGTSQVWTLVAAATQWDSGNFTPALMVSLVINTPLDVNIVEVDEITILKCKEVKATINIPPSTPADPDHVQMIQQVVVDDISTTMSDALSVNIRDPVTLTKIVAPTIDKNLGTYVEALTAAPWIVEHVFAFPMLISRVCATGNYLEHVQLSYVAMDGTVIPVTGIITGPVASIDSGNFTPVMATGVILEGIASFPAGQTNSAKIRELVTLKTIEVKVAGVSSNPDAPVHVQALQQVVNDEVYNDPLGISNPDPSNVGTIASLLDKNLATQVLLDGAPFSGVSIPFKFPILISRVSYVGGSFYPARKDVIITVYDVNGDPHIVYDGSELSSPTYAQGVDSGNFKDQPKVVLGGRPQGSPIMATAISIVAVNDDYPNTWSIAEVTILKTIEVKSFVYNEPSAPVFTQDEGVICYDEVWWANNLSFATNLQSGDIDAPFLKSPVAIAPTLGSGGGVSYNFNSPKLIDRVVVQGNFSGDGLVEVLGLDLITPIWSAIIPSGFGGFDSGRITPMMGTVLRISAGSGMNDYATIYAINLYKVHGVMTEATQASPIQVEAEQQVVIDEIDWPQTSASNITGDIKLTLDKDFNTGVDTIDDDSDWSILYFFKAPKLISRISVIGIGLENVTIAYIDVNVNIVVVADAPSPTLGVDSGNFTPAMVLGVVIQGHVPDESPPARIIETTILKTIETKATVVQSPAYPLQVEAEQQIVNDEIDLPASIAALVNPSNLDTTDLSILFKKNFYSGFINYTYPGAPAPVTVIRIQFHTFQLISRAGLAWFYPVASTLPLQIIAQKVDGTSETVYSKVLDGTEGGADSGNFTPALCWAVDLVLPDVSMTLQEAVIFKTIETKSYVFNTPKQPLQVEAEQQVVMDEIASITVDGDPLPNGEVLFNKDLTTTLIIDAEVELKILFKMPKLISRVVIVGDMELSNYGVIGINGVMLPLVNHSADAFESDNFAPMMAIGVQFTVDVESEMSEMVILKTIEVKSAINRNADTETIVIPVAPTFTIAPTVSASPDGSPVPPLSNLFGQGIEIDKNEQKAVCLEIDIKAANGIGTINADVHWFYSNDNTDWYFMATYNIAEAVSATNPSGFIANAGTAKRQIAQPVGAFNKYICIAVRNNDVANSIVVSAKLVKQR